MAREGNGGSSEPESIFAITGDIGAIDRDHGQRVDHGEFGGGSRAGRTIRIVRHHGEDDLRKAPAPGRCRAEVTALVGEGASAHQRPGGCRVGSGVVIRTVQRERQRLSSTDRIECESRICCRMDGEHLHVRRTTSMHIGQGAVQGVFTRRQKAEVRVVPHHGGDRVQPVGHEGPLPRRVFACGGDGEVHRDIGAGIGNVERQGRQGHDLDGVHPFELADAVDGRRGRHRRLEDHLVRPEGRIGVDIHGGGQTSAGSIDHPVVLRARGHGAERMGLKDEGHILAHGRIHAGRGIEEVTGEGKIEAWLHGDVDRRIRRAAEGIDCGEDVAVSTGNGRLHNQSRAIADGGFREIPVSGRCPVCTVAPRADGGLEGGLFRGDVPGKVDGPTEQEAVVPRLGIHEVECPGAVDGAPLECGPIPGGGVTACRQ